MHYKKNLTKILLFSFTFSLLFVSFRTANAQVTIGSTYKPNTGAILDLKEQNGDAQNITAKKGLGMARVQLKSKSSLLPLADETKDNNDTKHTGTLVYNVTNEGDLCSGLYIWNSQEWTRLGDKCNGRSLTILPSLIRLIIGDTFTPQIKLTKDLTGLNWISSNTEIATIDANTGEIIAKKEGTSNVTVQKENYECNTVNVEVAQIRMTMPNTYQMISDDYTGREIILQPTITPNWLSDEQKEYTWENISSGSIMKVAADGKLKIMSKLAGSETIKAVFKKYPSIHRAIIVEIKRLAVYTDGNVYGSMDSLALSPNEQHTKLKMKVSPQWEHIDRSTVWELDDDDMFTSDHTDDGTGHATAVITATTNAKFGKTKLRIRPKAASPAYVTSQEVLVKKCPSKFTDREGNQYTSQAYDRMCWMTQNLRATQKADGTLIANGSKSRIFLNKAIDQGVMPIVVNNEDYYEEIQTSSDIIGKGSITYQANEENITENYEQFAEKFGLLYTVEAAEQACPEGWRLPSRDEWKELGKYINSQNTAKGLDNYHTASSLKTGQTYTSANNYTGAAVDWNAFADNSTYSYGFNLRPAGILQITYEGEARELRTPTSFGSHSNFHVLQREGLGEEINEEKQYYVTFSYNSQAIGTANTSGVQANSIRCVF